MLKRILTAVLMLFVLLVVNSAGASNTIRIAYSDIDNFVGIKDGRLAGYGVALFDAIAEHTGWTYEYKSGSWEQCLEWVKNGEADKEDNVLINAPHPEYEVVSDQWEHCYTREKAAYPIESVRENKFWVNVARVDNTLGDRKLLPTRYGTFE